MDIVLAFLASSVPALIAYLILRKRNPGKPGYAEDCKKAFLNGIKSTFPVVPCALNCGGMRKASASSSFDKKGMWV